VTLCIGSGDTKVLYIKSYKEEKEKIRRDKLNEQFIELASTIDE